jgi:hypothetical protein
MDKTQYETIKPFRDLMKKIIVNSAASNLPIEYRTTLEAVGKELGYKLSCTCSSGWFTLTSRVYNEMLTYEETNKKKNGKKIGTK